MHNGADALQDTTAFVTGASGFIGGHLCRVLAARGATVHALSREDRDAAEADVQWWQGRVEDGPRMQELVEHIRPDLIFHLASRVTGARDRRLVVPILRANLLGTIHLLDAASAVGCERIVLAGSLVEPDDARAAPPSPYAAAKWASSAYARMYHLLYDTPAVVLRLGMVYGPGQPDLQKLVPYVTLALLRGQAPEVSSGHRRVDWVYVGDVVEALVRSVTAADVAGKTLDVGTGTLHSIREVVEGIAAVVGGDVQPAFGARAARAHEQEWKADTARTRKHLAWEAQTALSEGLRRTVAWYRTFLASSKGEHVEALSSS